MIDYIKKKVFILLYLFLALEARKQIKSIDNYSEWCDEDTLFKPYVKYYFGGRLKALETGIPDVTHGPGQHYDFLSQKNTYICINGLAWMYYANVTSRGLLVLVQPELHIYKHVCMLTNYDLASAPGWTTPRNESIPLPMLYSILLMGEGTDYRKPSLELITAPTAALSLSPASPPAPVTDPLTLSKPLHYVNGTSFVIIGDEDTECKVRKGTAYIRIRTAVAAAGGPAPAPGPGPGPAPGPAPGPVPGPAPPADGDPTFCKFSYSMLKEPLATTTLLQTDGAVIVDNTDVLFAAQSLQDHGDLIKEGCFVPANYTQDTIKIVADRKSEIEKLVPAPPATSMVVTVPSEYLVSNYSWVLADALFPPGTETYDALAKLVETDPCTGTLPAVTEACNPPPSGPACPTPPKEAVPECGPPDPTLTTRPVCDSCDNNDQKVRDYIKALLANIKVFEAATTVDPASIATAKYEIALARLKPCAYNLWQLTSKLGTPTAGAHFDTLGAWDIAAAPMLALQTYVTDAPLAITPDLIAALKIKKQEAAAAISKAQMLLSSLKPLMQATKKEYSSYVQAVKDVLAGKDPNCKKKKPPALSGVVTVARGPEADYIKPLQQVNKDPSKYPADTSKTCAKLPTALLTCTETKPSDKRACQCLNARMGNYIDDKGGAVTWKAEDAWRESILNYVADIFSKSCEPMVKPAFAKDINSVIKGYLLDTIEGTLKSTSVTRQVDDACTPGTAVPPTICENVTEECDTEFHKGFKTLDPALSTTDPKCPVAPLPARRAYWDQLENALRHCKDSERVLKFKRKYKDDDKDKPFDAFIYTLMGKPYKELVIEHNIEQADLEYAFNYVIDSFWRMFATTLALCMPYIEKELPDVSRQYFAIFTEDFLYPLAREWKNNRDNPVFELILGAYYGKKTDYWAKLCMESAFIRTGDVRWRPPRKLLVNGRSEMNYFVEGPVFNLGVKRIYGDMWDVGRFG